MTAANDSIDQLKSARIRHEKLLSTFRRFHELAHRQIDPEFCTWVVGDLAADHHSFEIEFLDQRVLCVFSLQRWASDHGLLSFYLLSRINEKDKRPLYQVSYSGHNGRTDRLHFYKKSDEDFIGVGTPLGARELVANVLVQAMATGPTKM